jgi:hypothetical protein
MIQIPINGLRLTTLFIAGSMLLSSLTGCGVYKDWKQKEQARMIQTAREEILMEIAERKAEREANKNWLQRHWTGVSITSIVMLTTAVVGMASFILLNPPQSIVVDATQEVVNQISRNARKISENTQKISENTKKIIDTEIRIKEDEMKIDVNKGQAGAARKDASGALSKVWGIKDSLYQNEQKLNDISQKAAAANNLAIKNADKIVDLSRAVDQLKK